MNLSLLSLLLPLLPFTIAQLAHPAISPGAPSNFATDLEARLPPAQVGAITPWDAGWIPSACYRETVKRGFSPSNVEVKNVRFADCDREWAVCKLNTANIAWSKIVETFSRIPVGMRQYAANALIVPDANGGGCATVDTGPIIITTAGCWDTHVILHEMTHVLDFWALQDLMVQNGYTRGQMAYSSSWMWTGAYDRDSHVVTEYARSNQVENFAEVADYGTMDRLTPGGVEVYIGSRKDLINDQIGNWRVTMEPHIWTSTGRCTSVKRDTTGAVSTSTGLRRRGERVTAEKLPFKFPICTGPPVWNSTSWAS